MLQKLEEKLNLNAYDPNTPMYMDYASSIYCKLVKDKFHQFKSILPSTFTVFIDDIKVVFKELENQELKINTSFPTIINNASEIIELFDDLMVLLKNNTEHLPIFLKIVILQKTHLLTVMSLQSNQLIYSNDEILHFLEKKIQFSQSEIAKEWKIDNDTLSKWFAIQYGTNIYAGRKKINLSEYLQIFNDFFVLDEDKRTIISNLMIENNNIDFYNSLALKGKTYSKKDIIEECFNPDDKPSPRQYAEAKKILESKFSYYSEVDKFPSSIAFQLIDELRKFV